VSTAKNIKHWLPTNECIQSTGGITLKGEKVLGEKPVLVSFCPPQILHDSPGFEST
jgi:hypothetical protein